MCKELEKVENVVKVVNFQTNSEYIEKEVCLLKVSSYNPALQNIINFSNNLNGRTLIMNDKITILKIEGGEEEVTDFVNKVAELTKDVEICRSGMVAIAVDEKIESLMVENEESTTTENQ